MDGFVAINLTILMRIQIDYGLELFRNHQTILWDGLLIAANPSLLAITPLIE